MARCDEAVTRAAEFRTGLDVLRHFRRQMALLGDTMTLDLLSSIGNEPFTNRDAREAMSLKRQASWKRLAQLSNLGLVQKRGHSYKVAPFTREFVAAVSFTLGALVMGKPVTQSTQASREALESAIEGLEVLYAKGRLNQDEYASRRTALEARFGNSDPLLEWSAIGGGVDVRYSRGAGQAYVMRLDQGHLPKVAHSLRWLLGGIRVVERPNVSQGVYLLGMSEEIREITRQKLNETVDGKAYARLRGDIGEGVVRLLLPRMRMELLYDHPWSDLSHRLGSLRHGPDFMANCQDSGLAVYVEVKWWENVLEAFRRGGERVGYYVHNTPVWRGIKLDGGYIAVLDWKLGKTAKLWVERVV